MAPVRLDPAALLRDHFESREAGHQGLDSAARIGRARLSQTMAQSPARQTNVWVPALSGLAAAAVIGGAAFFHFQDRGPASPARTPAPVQIAAVALPAVESPAPAVSSDAPSSAVVPVARRVPKPDSTTLVQVAQASSPLDPRPSSLVGGEPAPLEVRLAKSAGGIVVSWDGPASVRQYELRKTCVDFRNPGGVLQSSRIRLNQGTWLDTAPDACGSAATQYEVAELTA